MNLLFLLILLSHRDILKLFYSNKRAILIHNQKHSYDDIKYCNGNYYNTHLIEYTNS